MKRVIFKVLSHGEYYYYLFCENGWDFQKVTGYGIKGVLEALAKELFQEITGQYFSALEYSNRYKEPFCPITRDQMAEFEDLTFSEVKSIKSSCGMPRLPEKLSDEDWEKMRELWPQVIYDMAATRMTREESKRQALKKFDQVVPPQQRIPLGHFQGSNKSEVCSNLAEQHKAPEAKGEEVIIKIFPRANVVFSHKQAFLSLIYDSVSERAKKSYPEDNFYFGYDALDKWPLEKFKVCLVSGFNKQCDDKWGYLYLPFSSAEEAVASEILKQK